MPQEIVWGLIGFGFFLILWAILPARLRRRVMHPFHHAHPRPSHTGTESAETQPAEPLPQLRRPIGRPAELIVRLSSGPHGYRITGHVDGFGFDVPVYSQLHRNGIMRWEVFSVEIMGVQLRCQQMRLLAALARGVLARVMAAGRWPTWALQIQNGGTVRWLPVYPWDGTWRVFVPDGPVVEAPDAGTLRTRVAACEDLPIDALTPVALSSDLRWMPAVGVLKPTDTDNPWMPVFVLGGVACVVGIGRMLTFPLEASIDWPTLIEQVEAEVRVPLMLFSCDVADALERDLPTTDAVFRYVEIANGRVRTVRIPVWANRSHLVGVIRNHSIAGAICAAGDLQELRNRLARYLHGTGQIREPEHLQFGPSSLRLSSV